MITLTCGTAFIMWLGEQITERGIGNGISLIIFAGIIIRIPSAIGQLFQLIRTDQFTILGTVFLIAVAVGVIFFVVIVERGQRRIPIQHARRVVGKRVMQGGMSYFPLRVNTAGVIPAIFASSLLMFPLTIGQFTDSPAVQGFIDTYLDPSGLLYQVGYVGLIVFFAYFYTAIMINPTDVADNIKKSGAYIPGIRPGKKTAEYIDRILSRVTLVGALYIAAVCVLPTILAVRLGVPFYFGGTALLIAVGVGPRHDRAGRGASGLAAVRGLRARARGSAGGSRDEVAQSAAAGRSGRRQGHPGDPSGGAARRAPRLDRGSAARRGRGGDAARARGQGDHGSRRAGARFRRDRPGGGASGAPRREDRLRAGRLPAHRRPGRGARRRSSRGWGRSWMPAWRW